MLHWKMMNIYCTFLNTDTHKYKVTSPGSGLISLGGNQRNETKRTVPQLNKYLHPTHYINNMTFTIYNNKRFVLKEEHFSVGMLVFFVVFCNRGIIVIVSAFVLFIVRNVIVLLVGW